MRPQKITTCYLCGKPLSGRKVDEDDDHVPPKQLLAKELRRKYQIRLVTLRTHQACNSSFNLDEEYFKHCLIPFARGSEAGDAIWRKAVREYWSGEKVRLVDHVLRQAKPVLNGVLLPRGKVWLDYDRSRIDRVIGKIIKGLHYADTREVITLPANLGTSITFPGQRPPDDFIEIMSTFPTESRGEHQGVFAYRSNVAGDLHYWSMLLWDRIIITACFRTLTERQTEVAAPSTTFSTPSA